MKFFCVLVAFFFCSCGIPTYQYLEPPIITQEGVFLDAKFRNTTENDPKYFRGYRLFYKLYYRPGVCDSEIKQIKNSSASYMIRSKKYRMLAEANNDFNSEHDKINKEIAIVRIKKDDANKNISFIVEFDESGDKTFNSKVVREDNGDVFYLCRYIIQNRKEENETDKCARSFKIDDFTKDDADIPKKLNGKNKLYMALFVVSFGWDNNYSPLYSEPKFLGKFEFDVKPSLE